MRGYILMLLLFAANAHNFLWVLGAVDEDKVSKQLNRMEMDEYMAILNIKSLISRILQANDKIADRLEKLENAQNRSNKRIEGLVTNKTDRIEEHMTQMDQKLGELQSQAIKAEQAQNKSNGRIDEINSQTKNISEHLHKNEETLESVKTRVEKNAHWIKLPECARWLQTQNLNRTHFFSAQGQYFYFNMTNFIWSKTRDWCVEKGMQLAMLKTTSQMDTVAKELKKRNATGNYWMDASDVGQPAGQFRWADGTLVDGSTWRNGKIYKTNSDLNERTCVDFSTDYVNLTDDRCSFVGPILCQAPSALAACL